MPQELWRSMAASLTLSPGQRENCVLVCCIMLCNNMLRLNLHAWCCILVMLYDEQWHSTDAAVLCRLCGVTPDACAPLLQLRNAAFKHLGALMRQRSELAKSMTVRKFLLHFVHIKGALLPAKLLVWACSDQA